MGGVHQVCDADEPAEPRIAAGRARRRIGELDLVLVEDHLLVFRSDVLSFLLVGRPYRHDEAAVHKTLELGTGDKAPPLLAIVVRGKVVDEEGLDELFNHQEIGCGTLKMCFEASCEMNGGQVIPVRSRFDFKPAEVAHAFRERFTANYAEGLDCRRRDSGYRSELRAAVELDVCR